MAMHWVVVGDGAGAKIYESDALLQDLALVDQLHLSHGHVTHGDGSNTAHLPGDGGGKHDSHDNEEKFARAVAQLVNEGDTRHKFERVILVAPPRFLGDVRGGLAGATAKKLVASIHHDWTKLGLRDLSEKIRKNLPEAAGM